MNLIMNDTAILVTSFTGGKDSEVKEKMIRTLCKNLKDSGYYICLASHSIVEQETQSYCNTVIYDSDNRFQINNLPPNNTNNHGVAELTSMHNGMNYLKNKGFTNVLKIAYDCGPLINYSDIILKCSNVKQLCVTARWPSSFYSMGTLFFYSNIDYFLKSLPLDEIANCDDVLESVWYRSVFARNMQNELMLLDTFSNFLGHNIDQYCHNGGTVVDQYNF